MSKSKPRTQGVDEAAEERDRSLGHYFVPEKVVEIANGTIPMFDIDPCAHPRQLIQAQEKVIGSLLSGVDGFTMDWKGTCFLNPPSFKRLAKDTVPNYEFHPLEDWINRGIRLYNRGDLSTLMVYSPARNGVCWYNNLMATCTLQFVFNQRVNCYIGQRNEDGEDMEPREMTSPFGGASLFLYSKDTGVVERFITACQPDNGKPRGVLQMPLPSGDL